MPLYALTIFTSAFLLFLVQPILAKQILPWFGGSAAVWTTCLVFFQFVLLLGYTYSDWTSRKLKPRTQSILHIGLLLASLLVLPILADPSWKPQGDGDPALKILGLLVVTIGLPYLLLSTTGPLLQAWLARRYPTRTGIYRLFALSNLASLLALLAYPFLLEPWVSVVTQSWSWSAGYALFVALCSACALLGMRVNAPAAAQEINVDVNAAEPASTRPGLRSYVLWVSLAALASALLLAVTNHITHDVASVPFLWLLPLTIYLLTFILCFEGRVWYRREVFLLPLLLVVALMAWSLHEGRNLRDIKESVALFSAGLFVCCMFLHGELANSKPPPAYLTGFYLAVSLGGTLGGIGVGLVAPRVFNSYYEFPLGLMLTLGIGLFLMRRMPKLVPAAVLATMAVTGYHIHHYVESLSGESVHASRSFYGTLRVQDRGSGEAAVRRLMHGIIMHGEQYLHPTRRLEPTTYYGETSGIGRLLKSLPEESSRVAVVGLGTGTIATYGRKGDVYRFYELDPAVIALARSHFSFLNDSQARTETVLGDARLSMEREEPQQYDVIALDAFSSDSIPVHLITRQAMAVYLKHLKPGGVIAFHVSNRFLSLPPVVQKIAEEASLKVAYIVDDGEDSELALTEWVLVSRDETALEREEIAGAATEIDEIPGLRAWTDDSNNLFRILK